MKGTSELRMRGVAILSVVLMALFGAVAAGCGSDDSGGSTGGSTDSGSSGGGSNDSLTVAVATARPVFGQPYIAETTGCFKKEGVDVKILDTTGSNTTTLVASGQADLGMLGAGAPLILAKQGKPTTIVYAHAGGGAGAVLVGGKDVKSIDDIKGKRIGVLGQGSSTYGFAVKYDKDLGLDADLVPLTDAASITAGLGSGRIAAATGSLTDYRPLVDKGVATVLIDPADPAQKKKYVGADYPEGATFGITDNLQSKKSAVQKVLKCYVEAGQFVKDHSDQEVAAELRKSDVFKAIPEADLAKAVAIDRTFLAPNGGNISNSNWDYGLTQYGTWGIDGFDAKDPTYSYDKRVDMSYLDAANQG